jgi:hypothetical protein
MRWLLLGVLWLMLTDSAHTPELAAGAAAAALGASLAGLVSRPGTPRVGHTFGALADLGLRRLARPLVRLMPDTLLITGALCRSISRRERVSGSFRLARYPVHGRGRRAATRTVTEAWGSLAPNRYVVGIDEEAGGVLVHELVPSEQPVNPLEARGRP